MCGFQLYVGSSSTKPSNFGNAKYKCKILNGQQFFYPDANIEELECPFFMNAYGHKGEWKLTKANLCHNHLLFVGSTKAPLVEGTVSQPERSKRNTTESVKRMTDLIKRTLLPAYGGRVSDMSGKVIQEFLLSEGCGQVSLSAISRMKTCLDASLRGDLMSSYQKLEAYFTFMAAKNPGSFWRIEREGNDSNFKRACFFPNAAVRAASMAKLLVGFDGLHLKDEMNAHGIFLVATAKDYNDHIIPFGLALVPVENYEHWCWFLDMTKQALGGLDRFTVVSDRQKGLISAIADTLPNAGHRFCLRHIMDNITRTVCSLTANERRLICSMAKSDCENDYDLFESELQETKASAVAYLKAIDQIHWVKFRYQDKFRLPTYGEITSNLSEQANSWMTNELRSAKPLNAFSLFFLKLSELMSSKRQIAGRWMASESESKIVPVLAKKRTDIIKAARSCKPEACMDGGYIVRYKAKTDSIYIHPWRFVDLPESTCTCGNWQDTLFPCPHAVYAAVAEGKPVQDLYDKERLSIGHFKATYSHPFKPYPADIVLQLDGTLQLPVTKATLTEKGKRGLKPGPKSKHKRKQSKRKA